MHVSFGRATKILISSFIMLSELQKIICPFPFFRLSKLLGSTSLKQGSSHQNNSLNYNSIIKTQTTTLTLLILKNLASDHYCNKG